MNRRNFLESLRNALLGAAVVPFLPDAVDTTQNAPQALESPIMTGGFSKLDVALDDSDGEAIFVRNEQGDLAYLRTIYPMYVTHDGGITWSTMEHD